MHKTRVLLAKSHGFAEAASLLQEGALVAFPTETVYGLGGDATNDTAVARIFEAKERPSFNPLIVHVADIEAAKNIAVFDDMSLRLAGAFWPGPLTLVLPLRPQAEIAPLVTAGLESIALRIPEHPVAQSLLEAFGGPIAAPSANPSGKVSPTRAEHVIQGLSGRIEAVLDGGACPVGLESTIIGLVDAPALLRPGGLPLEDIEECIGSKLSYGGDSSTPTAPGQLTSHYAPQMPIRLNASTASSDEVLLGFGPDCAKSTLNLSETGDLVEAAANLFHFLREIDGCGQKIAVSPIPEKGLGRAINDRLRRAAAPRA